MTTKGYGVLQCDDGREQTRNFQRDGATRLTLPDGRGSAWTLITTLDEHGNYGFAIETPGFKKVFEVGGNIGDFQPN